MAISYDTLKSFCGKDDYRAALRFAVKRKDGWWATDGRRIICVPMEHTQQGDLRFLSDEFPDNVGKFPNVESIIDVAGFTPKFTLNALQIKRALDKLPLVYAYADKERAIKYITCPECDGDRTIEIDDTVYFNGEYYDVSAECECPICHGYGVIPDFKDYNPDKDDYDPEVDKTITYKVKTKRKVPDTSSTLIHLKDVAYFDGQYLIGLLQIAREQGVIEIECAGGDYVHLVLFRLDGVIVGLMPTLNEDDRMPSIDIETD